GRGQSLNMRDNGVNVIVGQRKGGKAYDLCLEDGWVPGKTLFDPEEAAAKGTVIQYLLSDAGQKDMWPKIKPHLTAGKALYFSHGFAIVFNDQTGVVPPKDIDVLREHGHSPSEAFNETVEEATQSLYPLIAEKGMDWMYANCSTTAQRGALDWFTKFRDASKPDFEELYQRVADGSETRRVLESNSRKDYRAQLEK